MKKIVATILTVVVLLTVGAVVYLYYQQKNEIFSAKDKLPSGYFIPTRSQFPSGYELEKKAFTDSSVLVIFEGKLPYQRLSFVETATGNYASDVVGSASFQLNKHTIQKFSYLGNPEVITGDFEVNAYDGSDQGNPNQLDNEYTLFYNHNGREVEIHTYDVKNITPAVLLHFLQNMQITSK